MTRFLRIRRPDGTYYMLEQPQTEPVEPIILTEPLNPNLVAGSTRRRYYCTACSPEKAFKGVGIVAMHFKRAHKDLYKDSNSFKEHIRLDANGSVGE